MSKIYVITKGCYSDYQVIGATLDKQLAERLAEMHTDSFHTARVEEFEDGQMSDWYTPKQYCRVWMNADLDEFNVDRFWEDPNMIDDHPTVKIHTPEEGKWRYEIDPIDETDNAHAIKIAFDTLAAYVAMENMM